MAWTEIDNSLVSVGALPFATTIQALRDNPIAIANGDAGAPKVQTAAYQDGSVQFSKLATGAGETDWVANRNIDMGIGGKGSYAMLAFASSGSATENQNAAGSSLRYTDASGASIGSAPAGTWRCMGRCSTVVPGPDTTFYNPGVWLRIA